MKLALDLGRLGKGLFLGLCLLLFAGRQASARTVPDPSNPLGCFSSIADKLLRSTFSFGVTNIPVEAGGVFVYSPAVQRLLQLSANITDAANTNFYPSVFRPLFSRDIYGNLFVTGYTNVASVSGTADLAFSQPIDAGAVIPPVGTQVLLNVYGVPWIIGAKKGLPNFNSFYMLNEVQVTRLLQVSRARVEPYTPATAADFVTNQLFLMSITNNLGFSFWNSYSNYYQGDIPQIVVNDTLQMVMTNSTYTYVNPAAYPGGFVLFSFTTNLTFGWPGSAWNPNLGPASPAAADSFVFNSVSFPFLTTQVLSLDQAGDVLGFQNVGSGFPTVTSLPNFPAFGLATTNWLQAYIIDNGHVLDYVQFSGPSSERNILDEIGTDLIVNTAPYQMWATNASKSGVNLGVANQLLVSRTGPAVAPPGQWKTPPNLSLGLQGIAAAEAAFFEDFFTTGQWLYNGVVYPENTNLTQQAPFIPTRTLYEYTMWQANDPLVHYLASDLNDYEPGKTGLHKSDDPTSQPLPAPSLNTVGDRYQPWGRNNQIYSLSNVDKNPYNLAYRDPLVWGSDAWNFPSTNGLPLTTLGQVHRGTPWQTVYLKATNIWDYVNTTAGNSAYGSITWTNWTGDADPVDAATELPVADWRLAGLLMNWFNPNNATQLMSVNDTNTAYWLNILNGFVVETNSSVAPNYAAAPQLDSTVMSGGSPQASFIANAIVQNLMMQPDANLGFAGDILATPALAEGSPWLDTSSATQVDYGISDQAYEAIPSQLLPLLRPDSVGGISETNGSLAVTFSGSDGLVYALQASPDLIHWTTINTNCPVQGRFIVPINLLQNSQNQFFRSILLP